MGRRNSQRGFRFSLRTLLIVTVLAAAGLHYSVSPSARAHRFARSLNSGTTELGDCDATIDPIDLSQLLSGTRTVRAKAPFGFGFKQLVYRISSNGVELESEEIPVEQWMWGLPV